MTDDPTTTGHNGKCNALVRQPEYDGDRCDLPAGWGTTHTGVGACRKHGGSTRNHARFAEVETARRQVELWGGRQDVHPAQALLDLVQWKASEVAYWRFRVAELAEEDLTWGVSKTKTGGDDHGTTEEAKPHIALAMLRQAERDLADYAAASLKAGVDAAMVEVTRAQAETVVALLQAVLGQIGLTPEQEQRAPEVIVGEMRRLALVTGIEKDEQVVF